MTVNEKIAKIREMMQANGIDAVIVPSADPHMSEYFSDHWKTRAWLSGFTGSAGTFVITKSIAGLWTDGRYYVQAEKQLAGSEGVLFKMNEPETPKVYEYLAKELPENAVVGINGKLFSASYVQIMKDAFAKKNIQIKITKKELETISRKILLEEFYLSEGGRYLSLEFKTPTAFKQNGRYVNYPDIRLLFQSLMNKYGTGSYEMEMFDEETLEQLTRDITVSRYKLHSVMFPMEGIRIPAFMGNMTIQISGPKTMASYARMLVRFGEYSGVGIKTGMGMGGIRIIEGRKNDRREN